MCGRARCTLHPRQILAAVAGDDGARDHTATGDGGTSHSFPSHQLDRYRPGAHLPVVRLSKEKGKEGDEGEKEDELVLVIDCMKWGLIPCFTKSSEKPDHFRMFNARSESIKEKASFRRLIPKNRCLVAVEGFYEWKKDGSKKQPYYIHFKDHRPLVFAALYDTWKNSEGETLHTFTILTTCASSALQWLHDRMPVILGDKSSIDSWLKNSTEKIESLLRPYEAADLVWYPVSTEVGKPSFNGPECIKEIKIKSTCAKPISKFFAKKTDEKDHGEDDKKSSGNFTPDSAKAEEDLDATKEEPDVGKHIVNFPVFNNEVSKPDDRGSKRELEDLTPISGINPVKKERAVKNSGDRQVSLLSYFGKK